MADELGDEKVAADAEAYSAACALAAAGAPAADVVPRIMAVTGWPRDVAMRAYLAASGAPRDRWDDVVS